jgi:AcrR family transcriptional regulator
MASTSPAFQRARSPEQVEARRAAILDTARELLSERPVADVSLRELSAAVGLAKSNVLRYFDSREAIFLELMDEAWRDWLDVVEGELVEAEGEDGEAAARGGRSARGGTAEAAAPWAVETRVATVVARTLAQQRLLCELISTMAIVLEKNIELDYARDFKRRAAANATRLAQLVRAQLPQLDEDAGEHFAGATFVIVAGLWPYETPTPVLAQVMEERGVPLTAQLFADNLREGLITHLVGLSARAAASAGGA